MILKVDEKFLDCLEKLLGESRQITVTVPHKMTEQAAIVLKCVNKVDLLIRNARIVNESELMEDAE